MEHSLQSSPARTSREEGWRSLYEDPVVQFKYRYLGAYLDGGVPNSRTLKALDREASDEFGIPLSGLRTYRGNIRGVLNGGIKSYSKKILNKKKAEEQKLIDSLMQVLAEHILRDQPLGSFQSRISDLCKEVGITSKQFDEVVIGFKKNLFQPVSPTMPVSEAMERAGMEKFELPRTRSDDWRVYQLMAAEAVGSESHHKVKGVFVEIAAHYFGHVERAITGADISRKNFGILSQLLAVPGVSSSFASDPFALSDFSEAVGMSAESASQAIALLEHLGAVMKVPGADRSRWNFPPLIRAHLLGCVHGEDEDRRDLAALIQSINEAEGPLSGRELTLKAIVEELKASGEE